MTLGITNSFLGTIAGSGGGAKILISASPAPSATVTTYSGYIVFKFTASGTLNVGAGAPGTADAFVLGGGFSGSPGQPAPNDGSPGGAGGAGGRRVASPGVAITGGTPVSVTVGGAASNSSFGPISSGPGPTGGSGGSGGAGSQYNPSNNGLPGASGGTGPSNLYETGSNQAYGGGGGGGGGGGIPSGGNGGGGGANGGGGGGRGAYLAIPAPFPNGSPGGGGAVNTGGGGGGGGGGFTNNAQNVGSGASGGSGVVIVRFPDAQFTT